MAPLAPDYKLPDLLSPEHHLRAARAHANMCEFFCAVKDEILVSHLSYPDDGILSVTVRVESASNVPVFMFCVTQYAFCHCRGYSNDSFELSHADFCKLITCLDFMNDELDQQRPFDISVVANQTNPRHGKLQITSRLDGWRKMFDIPTCTTLREKWLTQFRVLMEKCKDAIDLLSA